MDELKRLVQQDRESIINHRRELHRIPERALTEQKTSAYVADRLKSLGLEVQTGIAQYGVVGMLRTGEPGPTLMIRADMDALPIQEETGLAFASTHQGLMHACGHDAHMAILLGTVKIIKELSSNLKGNIKFVFQPAEEESGGAKPMIEQGLMENPHVDYSLGCHVWPFMPQGVVGVKPGPLMAAMDRFELTIKGRGGHGAMPHTCLDAIDVAVQVINALQRIVSRQMNPLSPTVFTVGTLQAGTAYNIIAGEAKMAGTTRTFDREVWQSWAGRLDRIVRGVCDSMGAAYELDFQQGHPPLSNDPDMAEVVRRCAAQAVGLDKVIAPQPTMGSEDMSHYLEKSKGCFYFLGVGREGCAPLHNSKFDFDEEILLNGVETHCRVALDLLSRT